MAMILDCIHSFLVHPEKKHLDQQTPIRGTLVEHSGRLFGMLRDVFEKADRECTHDITFDAAPDGSQQNDFRDLMLAYLRHRSLDAGRTIGERLQRVTTNKSGLGLLFLLVGKDAAETKIVLSRFPADSGILAEEEAESLSVQFLEKVFMKSATAYKAAVYRGKTLDGDFWDGRAVDKQINSDVLAISNYWIKEFLSSDFRATSAQGTKRLATAILRATRQATTPEAKQSLVAAARLASGLQGKTISIKDFCKRFNLSDATVKVVRAAVPNDAVFGERFRFSPSEFSKHIAFESVELDNGAILMAAASDFDTVFQHDVVDKQKQRVRYSTEGQVVDHKFRRSR